MSIQYLELRMALCIKYSFYFVVFLSILLTVIVSGEIDEVYKFLSSKLDDILTETKSLKLQFGDIDKRMKFVEDKLQGLQITTPNPIELRIRDERQELGTELKDKFKLLAMTMRKMLSTEKMLLRASMENMNVVFAELKSEIRTQMSVFNASLKEELKGIETKCDNMKSEIQNNSKRIYLLEENPLQSLNRVAFTVGLDRHYEVFGVSGPTFVPFSLLMTNTNEAQLNNGVFTCPESGLYKFQAYSVTKGDKKLFLEVFKNYALVASLWAHTYSSNAAAGNAVVLELSKGDDVKVMTRSSYNVSIHGSPDQIYTTFSGVQLDSVASSHMSRRAGFSVSLNEDLRVLGGQTLVYTNVITDVNNCYNKKNGIFTAPSDGLYIFHFFSLAQQAKEFWQDLYHENQYICSIYGRTSNDWATAGNTVILRLSRADAVFVKARNGRYDDLYGRKDELYSTFSGARLADNALAFSAGLSHNAFVAGGRRAVFDHIFVNTHNIYNPNNGDFTAPRSGVYEFNFHATGNVRLDLYHNLGYVMSLSSHTLGYPASGSNAVVLHLHIGDTIYVKAYYGIDLFGIRDQIYCTFSGYLIS